MCHGDFRPGNVLFDQDDRITGIIDWDWCYVGPQVSDLGLALVEWAFSDGASAPDPMAMAAFYRGYRSAFDAPPHRLDELLDWVRATCLASAGTFLCDALAAADRPASVRESLHVRQVRVHDRAS
ncbi:MAG: phosphotransferase [Pseudonocardiales bacterium]|nr:phosphotransferase [Pseudonocardiales bacterium]